MFNKGTLMFLASSASSQAVLAAQLLAAKIAEKTSKAYHGRMSKSQKRLTNGTPSTTFVRVTRQMQRSEFRSKNKAKYRSIRKMVAHYRKSGRPVPSINDLMHANGM